MSDGDKSTSAKKVVTLFANQKARLYRGDVERTPDGETALNEDVERRMLSDMDSASKDYVDLKLEASLAKIEARLSVMPSTGTMIATAFTSAVAVIGVILAAMSYGGDRFDGGVNLADQRQEQLQRDAEQDAIIRRLDALLAAQATATVQAPESPTE